jgi:hypothetical protein
MICEQRFFPSSFVFSTQKKKRGGNIWKSVFRVNVRKFDKFLGKLFQISDLTKLKEKPPIFLN